MGNQDPVPVFFSDFFPPKKFNKAAILRSLGFYNSKCLLCVGFLLKFNFFLFFFFNSFLMEFSLQKRLNFVFRFFLNFSPLFSRFFFIIKKILRRFVRRMSVTKSCGFVKLVFEK